MLLQVLQQIPDSFTVGLLVGLTLGIASRAAVRFLSIAATLLVIFELVHASGAL